MKGTGGTRKTSPWLVIGLLASLLAHALILLLPGWQNTAPKASRNLEISLAFEAPASRPETPEDDTEGVAEAPAQDDRPTMPMELAEAAHTEQESLQPWERSEDEPRPESGLQLRQQALGLVSREHLNFESPGQRSALKAAPVPKLPDSAGWLNDYVGAVSPSVDRWVGNDGSRHTRIVLASGQLVCGRATPPTPAEMFNPSMAMNVMHFRLCGRERPTPVDRTDPWRRVPGE